MTLNNFPLGDQSFAQIIDQNLLYADKTKYAYELYKSTMRHFFLARPRRFGKTLFLSSLEELFTGNRARFEKLWIGRSDYDFPAHPVIRLSLSTDAPDADALRAAIIAKLKRIADENNLKLKGATPDFCLGELLRALADSYGSKAVVLIDEYDAPVTRSMANPEVAMDKARALQHFYAGLKEYVEYIRLTFVTGVTRLGLIFMESGANHLNDISLDPDYNGICGFTLEECTALLGDRLEEAYKRLKARRRLPEGDSFDLFNGQISHWYSGYNWGAINPKCKTRIVNPVSILNFFQNYSFSQYWIQSGRPDYLTALMRAKPGLYLNPPLDSPISRQEITEPDPTLLGVVPALFHSGYLTMDKVVTVPSLDPDTYGRVIYQRYLFKFPNYEASSSYRQDCLNTIFNINSIEELQAIFEELQDALLNREAPKVCSILSGLLVPLSRHREIASERDLIERFNLIFSTLNYKIYPEFSGGGNLPDLCLLLRRNDYLVMKFRHSPRPKSPTPAEALAILANLARMEIPAKVLERSYAEAAMTKVGDDLIDPILRDAANEAQKVEQLARLAVTTLSKAEINEVLADLAERELGAEIIEKAMRERSRSGRELSRQDALKLAEKGWRLLTRQAERRPKFLLGLGLTIYGDGSEIDAVFD
jgi:hypothetical protein